MKNRVFLSLAVLIIAALDNKGNADVVLDTRPGNSAPPATLGPYSMTPFGLNNADPPPGSGLTTLATPLGGNMAFSFALAHERADPAGPYTAWNPSVAWGHGYLGDVYVPEISGAFSLGLRLPANVHAFYLYIQPRPDFGVAQNVSILFQVHDGSTGLSGSILLDKTQGAQYAGFYETTSDHALNDIVLSSAAPIAIGEFGIVTVPEPNSLALGGALAMFGIAVTRGLFRKPKKTD